MTDRRDPGVHRMVMDHARRDDFRRYIRKEVNPARVKAGLSEIRDDEAGECFRIINQFLDRWMGTEEPQSGDRNA